MRHRSPSTDPNLLVGTETGDDAGVYRLTEDLAIVQTLDFFPPVINDPFIYGQISAANSISDVYAMGGTPKTALNLVGYPDDKLSLDWLAEIVRGGEERCTAAGVVVLGGHTVRCRDQVRLFRHRHHPSRAYPHQRRRSTGRQAGADQAAGHRLCHDRSPRPTPARTTSSRPPLRA